ncbi:unnamed protein product [Paramecium pentaurelia]|uniref:Uncharacterized protein n=1 Tax=Paramecium pentaurelia TaxID=43138 RepID=A0A8S1X7X7_9CILI|nr:unnamed protein product [Paramecium pentaurelia]
MSLKVKRVDLFQLVLIILNSLFQYFLKQLSSLPIPQVANGVLLPPWRQQRGVEVKEDSEGEGGEKIQKQC